MTSDDLLAAIQARLDEIERIAKAARMGFFTYEVLAAVAAYSDARHVLVHDPATVLRRVAADKRVFERHKPVDARVEFSTFVCRRICAYCSDAAERPDNIFSQREWLIDDATQPVAWPCPDFRDLADGLGIDLEETTP